MIAQLPEERLVLLQSCFEPDQIGCVDVLVGYSIPGFRHVQRVSVDDDTSQSRAFDIGVETILNECQRGVELKSKPHLVPDRMIGGTAIEEAWRTFLARTLCPFKVCRRLHTSGASSWTGEFAATTGRCPTSNPPTSDGRRAP